MHKEKQTVLYIITRGYFGGAQKYVFELARSLPDPFQAVVAVGEGDDLPRMLEDEGVPIYRLNKSKRAITFFNIVNDILSLFEILTILFKTSPAVVHINSSKAGIAASVAGRVYNVIRTITFKPELTTRIIFTSHGWAFMEDRPSYQRALFRIIQWKTVLFSHACICVSDIVKNHARFMPFVQKKLHVIHNGIHQPLFKEKTFARSALLAHLNEKIWIGTISEHVANKGLDIAINAFARIAPEYPDAIFVIIGDGVLHEELQKLILELNLSDRIFLVGHKENASTYLPAFDMFTLTSRKEGLPYAILEAGTAKIPVIASRVGGIPEIIDSTASGILIRPKSVRELESALRFALNHPQEMKKMAQKLHQDILNSFSFERMHDKTISLYRTSNTST